jgi:hypothetical protein
MDNRERFRHLLKVHNIKQRESAVLISAWTERPCSERTVRSWINDPARPSSNPCPDWALVALEKAIGYMLQKMAQRAQAAQDDKETPQ